MTRQHQGRFAVRGADGKMKMVMAYSEKGAIRAFVDKYDPPAGHYDVRRVEDGYEWARFSVR